MQEQIYNQLKTPKTLDELHLRLNEIGVMWNKAQIQLFLEMDKKIIKSGDKWLLEGGEDKERIMEVIGKALENKPIAPIKLIKNQMPSDIIISEEEILKLAIESGKYMSPNGKSIKLK